MTTHTRVDAAQLKPATMNKRVLVMNGHVQQNLKHQHGIQSSEFLVKRTSSDTPPVDHVPTEADPRASGDQRFQSCNATIKSYLDGPTHFKICEIVARS